MIKRTMEKLQDMVIEEKVTKVDYQMESIRRFSYPYQALEEAVVNAFYHRDYQSYQAIIIEIEPDCVRIISYPVLIFINRLFTHVTGFAYGVPDVMNFQLFIISAGVNIRFFIILHVFNLSYVIPVFTCF